MKKYLLLSLPILFLLSAFSASAQLRETDISLSTSPAYPAPNQSVRAMLSSQATDLNRALMTWSLDGVEKLRGIGRKDFQFSAGGLGTSVSVSVSVETVGGANIQKTLVISPAEVDMIWEAVGSYVPPFYKGKALASSQGKIKVVAMPSFVGESGKVGVKNLSYSWTKDGKGHPQYSGWGKNYLMLQNSYLDTENEVSVQVTDIIGNATAGGNTTLRTGNPKILFYRYDPAFGILWNRALGSGLAVGEEGETIVAEPYFFSETDLDSPNLSFVWTLNGQAIEAPEQRNILSVKLENGKHGSAIIKTAVENVKALFQSASREISIQF